MISSPEQLVSLLNKLPSQIREQDAIFKTKKYELDKAKLSLSLAQSQALLNSNGNNSVEKKANAVVETEKEQKEVIEAQKAVDLEESQLEYLNNRFISLRKISSIETELIKSQLTGN